MTENEAYFKKIYSLKKKLDDLDNNYWDHFEEMTPEDHANYQTSRIELLQKLEDAYKGN